MPVYRNPWVVSQAGTLHDDEDHDGEDNDHDDDDDVADGDDHEGCFINGGNLASEKLLEGLNVLVFMIVETVSSLPQKFNYCQLPGPKVVQFCFEISQSQTEKTFQTLLAPISVETAI